MEDVSLQWRIQEKTGSGNDFTRWAARIGNSSGYGDIGKYAPWLEKRIWKSREIEPGRTVKPENRGGKRKLLVPTETAAPDEQELSEYRRKEGRYIERIARWREFAMAGTESGSLQGGNGRRMRKGRVISIRSQDARRRRWPRQQRCWCWKKKHGSFGRSQGKDDSASRPSVGARVGRGKRSMPGPVTGRPVRS